MSAEAIRTVTPKKAPESEPAIYRVDTVPPPEGESDAYNAPTKVGPMAQALIKQMMAAAEGDCAPSSGIVPRAQVKPPHDSSYSIRSAGTDIVSRDEIPRVVYEDDSDASPTLVGANAKPPVVPGAPLVPHFPEAMLPPQTLAAPPVGEAPQAVYLSPLPSIATPPWASLAPPINAVNSLAITLGALAACILSVLVAAFCVRWMFLR